LLNSLQSLTKLSYSYADTDFKEKTVAKIGAIWQDHRTGWSVLQAIATERNVWYVQDQAVIQLSRIAKIHSEALVYLQEFARQGKSEAIEALATHWRDNPQTLPIIQQQANKGKSLAIQALVTHWRDNPQTLPIIQQQANKGQSKAIEALANHWRDNPQTLPIIQQQANKGEHRAIEALANHWRDHAQTLPIIQQLANKAEGEIIGLLTALARITIDSEIGAIIETILARTDVDAKIKEGFQEFLYYSNFRDWRNPD
jgi:alanyl-tRNA synthetase